MISESDNVYYHGTSVFSAKSIARSRTINPGQDGTRAYRGIAKSRKGLVYLTKSEPIAMDHAYNASGVSAYTEGVGLVTVDPKYLTDIEIDEDLIVRCFRSFMLIPNTSTDEKAIIGKEIYEKFVLANETLKRSWINASRAHVNSQFLKFLPIAKRFLKQTDSDSLKIQSDLKHLEYHTIAHNGPVPAKQVFIVKNGIKEEVPLEK